jgi:hypothetical protein
MNEYQIIPLNPQHRPLKIRASYYDANEKAIVFRKEFETGDITDVVAIVNNDFIGAMRIIELISASGGTDETASREPPSG